MTNELRRKVWDLMLDADMNARYWGRLSALYIQRETTLKIFMAIMASGTVAGWGIWETYDITWKLLSSLSALLAITLPILNYQKKIESMTDLAGKWRELQIEYEDMWLTLKDKPTQADVISTYKKFRATGSLLDKKEITLPSHPEILKECQNDVIKSRGLL